MWATNQYDIRHCDEATCNRVQQAAEHLRVSGPSQSSSIALLATLCGSGTQSQHVNAYADLPDWLRDAVIRFRAPAYLQEGAQALADLAERSLDHINRTLQHHRGCTTTTLINQVRMELAAAQLRHRPHMSVRAVAAFVGLHNMAHFYKLFRAQYGCTPKTWRSSAHAQTALP